MDKTIYLTIKDALREKIERIHEADRYYRDNPDEAMFDLNAERRKKELQESFAALEWVKDHYLGRGGSA